jgi:hypothetical protein
MSDESKTEQFTLKISRRLREALDVEAKRRGITVSALAFERLSYPCGVERLIVEVPPELLRFLPMLEELNAEMRKRGCGPWKLGPVESRDYSHEPYWTSGPLVLDIPFEPALFSYNLG